VNQAILAWSFASRFFFKRPSQYCLIHSIHVNTALYSESSNIGLVVLAYFACTPYKFSYIYAKTTKPILLDSLHITAAVYSESSNIGLVVLQ
jgi:hypothetical protein